MSPPQRVVSGVPVEEEVTYPLFPSNRPLVFDDDNTERLKALLPALQKYNCLDSPVFKTVRSPWVRAFCDLYHPAGPWGPYRNTPAMDSKIRWNFKVKIKAIYHQLEKYKDNSYCERCPIREELHGSLTAYYKKVSYHKEFIAASEEICLAELAKPEETRAPIPSTIVDLVPDDDSVELTMTKHPSTEDTADDAGNDNPGETTLEGQCSTTADDGDDNDQCATTDHRNSTETTLEEQPSKGKVSNDGGDNNQLVTIAQETTDADPPTAEMTESPQSDDEPSHQVISDLEEQRSDASESLLSESDDEPSSVQEASPVKQPADGEQDDVSSTNTEKNDGGKRELFRADTSSNKKARTDSGVNNNDSHDNDDDEATHCLDAPPATFVCGTPPNTTGPKESSHADEVHNNNNIVTPAPVKSVASTEDSIQMRRTKLESLLSLRAKGKNLAVDGLCQRIQQKIDDLDEELFELINMQL